MNQHTPEDPLDCAAAQSAPASHPPGWMGTPPGAGRSDTGGEEPGGEEPVGPRFDPLDSAWLHARTARHWARHWWTMAFRGAAALVLGLLALSWPALTLFSLILIFAAYCVIDALLSAILAVRGIRHGGHWVWSALSAMVAAAAAAAALFYPGPTLVAFAIVLAAWALAMGVFTIAAAARLPADHGRGWMITGGAALVLLGLVLAGMPSLGLFTLVWIVAVGMVASGLTLLGLAFRLRLRSREERFPGAPTFP